MKKLLLGLSLLSLSLGSAFAQEDDCVVATFPHSINLEDVNIPDLPDCTSAFNAGSGNSWTTSSEQGDFEFDTNTLMYTYSITEAANAWFFTNGFLLEEGSSYKISYSYASHNSYFNERLKVSYGKQADVSSMTSELADHSFNSKETEEHIIEIESTDNLYRSCLDS